MWKEFWSPLCQEKMWLERIQRKATRMIQSLGSFCVRKGWENWACSDFGEILSPCLVFEGWLQKRRKSPFYEELWRGMICTGYSREMLNGHQRTVFHHEKISCWKWWIPQVWTLWDPSGQAAGTSRQHFYQERLAQVSLEILPAWNSLVLLMQEKNFISPHQGWPCSHQCHIPAPVWALTNPSKTRGGWCWGFPPVSFSQATQSLSWSRGKGRDRSRAQNSVEASDFIW